MRAAAGILLLSLWACTPAQAAHPPADTSGSWFEFAPADPLSFLLPYIPPCFLYMTDELKGFIRSDAFMRLREEVGDIRSTDAIFVRAMALTGDNAAMALLVSAVATFDHEIVGLRVPILSLAIPLTGESQEDFRNRVARLPRALYDDTPPSGDTDKLQHFFGSAFIACAFESRDVAERFGEFIEEGENAVVIEGALDDRDRRANRQGQAFGLALITDNHRYPSEFIRTAVIPTDAMHGTPPDPLRTNP